MNITKVIPGTNIDWRWLDFSDFDTVLLYRYLQLRQLVFVIEQSCIYPDLDDHDQRALHLVGLLPSGNLAACLRLLPPGEKYPEPSIGRVIVTPEFRGSGLGHELIERGLRKSFERFPGHANRIQAQAHLAPFYAAHGFAAFSEPYDEDGILHIDMRCQVMTHSLPQ